jgi:hypothetical protein
LYAAGADVGLEESNGMADEGQVADLAHLRREQVGQRVARGWKQINDGKPLRGKELVEGGEGESSAGMEEVGEMGLAKAGLAGQQGYACGAALDAP